MKNLVEIGPDIFIFKNFITEDIENKFLLDLSNNTEEQWDKTHFNLEIGDQHHDFWFSRVSNLIWPFEHLHAILINFFAPKYWVTGAFRFFCRLRSGETPPTIEESMNINKDNSHYNFFSKWRLGIYVGEFTGGEIVFPDFNDFTVAVSSRDLLLWRSNYRFYVKEVSSGTRYSYSDFLIDPFDHFFA